MDDLISRKALISRFERYQSDCEEENDIIAAQVFADCICELQDAPAVDAAPVVHGRWGEYESFPLTPSLNGCPCSVCKTHFSPSSIIVMKYGPNCGDKMDGGNDND